MNAEQINGLQAGNECNQLVARHAMGWKEYKSVFKIPADATDCFFIHPTDGNVFIPAHQNRIAEFRPSSDIGHAWKVVEKMRENGWLIEIMDEGKCWSVSFENEDALYPTHGNPLPLVLCRAALLVTIANNTTKDCA